MSAVKRPLVATVLLGKFHFTSSPHVSVTRHLQPCEGVFVICAKDRNEDEGGEREKQERDLFIFWVCFL